MKKGRHRRYEEARALKRSMDSDDIEALIDRLDEDPFDLPVTEQAGIDSTSAEQTDAEAER